jgi:hypothetical protein
VERVSLGQHHQWMGQADLDTWGSLECHVCKGHNHWISFLSLWISVVVIVEDDSVTDCLPYHVSSQVVTHNHGIAIAINIITISIIIDDTSACSSNIIDVNTVTLVGTYMEFGGDAGRAGLGQVPRAGAVV